jgi:F1F0 ATPase subunit 2
MNTLAALMTGFGIGLAFVGGLWVTVRCAVGSPRIHVTLAFSQALRMLLAAMGFYAVSREGSGFLLPALAGFWIARRILICRIGGVGHAD